jgi:hypothetical protein
MPGTALVKLVYKPTGLFISVVGGILAGAAFKRTWKPVAHEDEALKAIDRNRTWKQVLPAAALQGAVFGFVKAATDGAGATSFERATGPWPA